MYVLATLGEGSVGVDRLGVCSNHRHGILHRASPSSESFECAHKNRSDYEHIVS